MRLLAIAAIAVVAGCGPSAFQRGAAAFPSVTGPASRLFAVEYDAAGDLCRAEERFSYLRAHVDPSWGGAPPTLARAYLVPRDLVTGGEPGRCDAAERDRDALQHALRVVAGYGEALRALSSMGGYTGDLGEAASSLGALAGAAGLSPTVGDAVKNAGEPLRFIADLALRKWVERDLRRGLAERRFTKVLDVLDACLALAEEKRKELQTTVKGALTLLARQAKMAPGEQAPVGDAIAWFQLAERWNVRLAALEHKQRLYRRVLDDLRRADAALAGLAAGDEKTGSVGAIAVAA